MNFNFTQAILIAFTFLPISLLAQFDKSGVDYFVGTGSDTAYLVVDFNDSSSCESTVWGYIYSGTKTGEDMLNAVAADDVNLTVNIGGGFLNDILYNGKSGIGGSPDFWGTYSDSLELIWKLNTGIGETLTNGAWFGCSYTDFAPPLEPEQGCAAANPNTFTMADVEYFVGGGSDTAILVIDFLDGGSPSSYAWGYLFTPPATGENMLTDIALIDSDLSVVTGGGFLNDITCKTHSGIGGMPNYWGTWSGTNAGNLALNGGIGDTLNNGMWFGCSYTDFAPAVAPQSPTAVSVPTPPTGIELLNKVQVSVYPNPVTDGFGINANENIAFATVFSLNGQKVDANINIDGSNAFSNDLNIQSGAYILRLGFENGNEVSHKLIVE